MVNNWEVLKVLHLIRKVDILLYIFNKLSCFLLHRFFPPSPNWQTAFVRVTDSDWFTRRYGRDVLFLTSHTVFPFITDLHPKQEAAGSYKMLIPMYQTAWYLITEHLYSNGRRVTNPMHKPGNVAWWHTVSM